MQTRRAGIVDIVDSQVHINHLGIDASLAAMDAVGVGAVVVHESWRLGDHAQTIPSYPLAGGGFRYLSPTAELAAIHHPDRFGFVCEIDRRDPQMDALMAMMRDYPNRLGLRALVLEESGEFEAFERGDYDGYFECAQRHELPVFVYLRGRPDLLHPYAERFPALSLILDHCGVPFGSGAATAYAAAAYEVTISGGAASPPQAETHDPFATFGDVLALAKHPNVSLKWAHAPRGSAGSYPFADVLVHLQRALDAFGPQRVMWSSDHTVSRRWHTWAEALFCIKDAPGISDDDKEWILGKAARTILRWPA